MSWAQRPMWQDDCITIAGGASFGNRAIGLRAYTSLPMSQRSEREAEAAHLMAIYHFTVRIITRAVGRSVVSAAAYRAGQRLKESSTGMVFNYTRMRGVLHAEILAPKRAPDWVYDRLRLWNAVDAGEKRRDAQLAREIELGLPAELDEGKQLSLVREFVIQHFVSKGMIADLAIHRHEKRNPHAHILLTMRRLGRNGFGLKDRSWNTRARLKEWRGGWAEAANRHLAQAGFAARIDHRSLEAQKRDLLSRRRIGQARESATATRTELHDQTGRVRPAISAWVADG